MPPTADPQTAALLAALGDAAPDAARIAALLAARAAPADRSLHAAVAGPVEILRDRAGVPHIYAATSTDLYFGLGIAMAEDRLWQMDRLRRRALGRQAEILGPAYLAQDIAHLTVGLDRIAALEPARMDGATFTLAEAFVAGINRQIEAFGADLPVEFLLLDYKPEPFTVSDVVAIGRGIWWSLNGRIDRIAAAEAARFLPERWREAYLTPEAAEHLVVPRASPAPSGGNVGTDDATGSNNWAVTAERAGNGHALLAGDPHQPFWVPGSWYEYALHGPEEDCAGAGHPGFPGMWWGANGTAAWAITNNAASCRDLYREQLNPANPDQYRDGDTWRAFATRTLAIKVRGQADHSLTIRETTRGPLVNHLLPPLDPAGDPPLSLRWVGMEHMDDLRASIAIGRARTWSAFRAALSDWSVAVFNFVYADAKGNVGYQMAGRVPLRGRITPGYRDAANPEDRWTGHIPFAALPHEYNPARGYVASANQRIVGPDQEPPLYGAYSQGHRGVRIDLAFDSQPTVDRAATIRLQNDVLSTRATRMTPHILTLLAAAGTADAQAVAALLQGWDGQYRQDSVAATVFETLMHHWQRAVLARHIPEALLGLTQQQTGLAMTLLEQPALPYFPQGTPAALAEAATASLATLRTRLGADPALWHWGGIHIAHWRHPLSAPATEAAFDIGPAPVDGGSHTVRNTGGEAPPHAAVSGAEYRIVMDFADPDRFLAVQNIGNSGVPGSPHYADQFKPWLDGTYHTVELKRANIDVESTTRIVPG